MSWSPIIPNLQQKMLVKTFITAYTMYLTSLSVDREGQLLTKKLLCGCCNTYCSLGVGRTLTTAGDRSLHDEQNNVSAKQLQPGGPTSSMNQLEVCHSALCKQYYTCKQPSHYDYNSTVLSYQSSLSLYIAPKPSISMLELASVPSSKASLLINKQYICHQITWSEISVKGTGPKKSTENQSLHYSSHMIINAIYSPSQLILNGVPVFIAKTNPHSQQHKLIKNLSIVHSHIMYRFYAHAVQVYLIEHFVNVCLGCSRPIED